MLSRMGPGASHWKDVWGIAANVGNLIGLGAAGVWGYFNFVKSRTYYPRLELTASGEIRSNGTKQYIVPRVTLKNIGKSKVQLDQSGTGYRIWFSGADADESGELSWSGGKPVHSIFEEHSWIEPGESIFDELRLFKLPKDCVAAKIQVRLTARIGWPNLKSTAWNCSTVVGPRAKREDESHESATRKGTAATETGSE
jgi:hypothetical protein